MSCYRFEKLVYDTGLLDDGIDATYIIHLEGNGRYADIMNQLRQYQPSKTVYILFNKGFKKCKKDPHINIPPLDLIDAFLHIFKHANQEHYGNILILEDDFMFSEKIHNPSTRHIVCNFLNQHKSEDFQYLLGCAPYIRIPYSIDLYHYIINCAGGTHAVIYSESNRDTILHKDKRHIKDWDIENNFYSRRYMYHEPLCYQLYPETENSKNGAGDPNDLMYILNYLRVIVLNIIKKLLSLDTQVEPGYSILYMMSLVIPLIFLVFFGYILYALRVFFIKSKKRR